MIITFSQLNTRYICDLLVVKQKFHFLVFIAKILVTLGHRPSERNERGNKPHSFVVSVAGKFVSVPSTTVALPYSSIHLVAAKPISLVVTLSNVFYMFGTNSHCALSRAPSGRKIICWQKDHRHFGYSMNI